MSQPSIWTTTLRLIFRTIRPTLSRAETTNRCCANFSPLNHSKPTKTTSCGTPWNPTTLSPTRNIVLLPICRAWTVPTYRTYTVPTYKTCTVSKLRTYTVPTLRTLVTSNNHSPKCRWMLQNHTRNSFHNKFYCSRSDRTVKHSLAMRKRSNSQCQTQ